MIGMKALPLFLFLCLHIPHLGQAGQCEEWFAKHSGSQMMEIIRIQPSRDVVKTMHNAGFEIKGTTQWGVSIIDATTFPMGGSGPVRFHVQQHPLPDPQTGIRLEIQALIDSSGNNRGTVVLFRRVKDNHVVFVALPPGHETGDREANLLALEHVGRSLH